MFPNFQRLNKKFPHHFHFYQASPICILLLVPAIHNYCISKSKTKHSYKILNFKCQLFSALSHSFRKSYKTRMINVKVYPIKQPGLHPIAADTITKYQSVLCPDCPAQGVQVLLLLDTHPSLLDSPLQHSPIYTATSPRRGSP